MNKEKIASELLKIARSLVSLDTKFPKFKNMIPSQSGVNDLIKIKPKGTDLEIWTWNREFNNKALYEVLILSPHTKRPKIERASSESSVERYVNKTIDNRKRMLERREAERKERAEYKHGYKVGDFVSTSWGYDQTNVEFYEVIDATEKSVKIREVAKKVVKSSQGADYVVPVPGKFVDGPMTKRVSPGGYVKINSSATGTEWDGKPKYETASGYGH